MPFIGSLISPMLSERTPHTFHENDIYIYGDKNLFPPQRPVVISCFSMYSFNPFIRSFVRSFVCSFVHSFIRSFVSFVLSFFHSFARLFILSFIRSFVHSFVLSFVRHRRYVLIDNGAGLVYINQLYQMNFDL